MQNLCFSIIILKICFFISFQRLIEIQAIIFVTGKLDMTAFAKVFRPPSSLRGAIVHRYNQPRSVAVGEKLPSIYTGAQVYSNDSFRADRYPASNGRSRFQPLTSYHNAFQNEPPSFNSTEEAYTNDGSGVETITDEHNYFQPIMENGCPYTTISKQVGGIQCPAGPLSADSEASSKSGHMGSMLHYNSATEPPLNNSTVGEETAAGVRQGPAGSSARGKNQPTRVGIIPKPTNPTPTASQTVSKKLSNDIDEKLSTIPEAEAGVNITMSNTTPSRNITSSISSDFDSDDTMSSVDEQNPHGTSAPVFPHWNFAQHAHDK